MNDPASFDFDEIFASVSVLGHVFSDRIAALDLHLEGAGRGRLPVREAVLADYPQIADLLAPVFAKLDLATLQDLNGRVQVGGEPAAAVATDFLSRAGLAK